ncbi:MAG TPA: hypothetical protein DEA22_05960 [Blastocatellia bacterium]|nr:hypothetical protein [Blastocatellia bacterium]
MHNNMKYGAAGTIRHASIFFTIAIFSACGTTRSENMNSGRGSGQEPATEMISVSSAKTESRQIQDFIQATGTLIADETSNVAPKTAGKLSNISVNAGDFVREGAVIAKIDDRDAKLQLAAANANLKQAIVSVRQAEARLGLSPSGTFEATAIPEVRAARSNFEQQQAELRQAEANEKRYRELVETGDVPMMTYEQYRTTRDTAKSRFEAAREQLETAINAARQNNEAIRSAEASVEASRTQVATAEQALADTVITAPFTGFVTARPVAVGEFVSTASVIATIIRSNPMKIQIQVAEADVPNVVLGRSVSVEVDAYRGRRFSGVVTAINPAVDTASRSALIEASIENNDNALRSGMFATARVTKEGGSTGIFAPKSAVYNHQATQSFRAFVIENGIAKLKVLQLGNEEGDWVQILSGLNADETVATSNLDQLFEGAHVSQ